MLPCVRRGCLWTRGGHRIRPTRLRPVRRWPARQPVEAPRRCYVRPVRRVARRGRASCRPGGAGRIRPSAHADRAGAGVPPRPAPRPAPARPRRIRSPPALPATWPAALPAVVTLTVINQRDLWATRVRVDSRVHPACGSGRRPTSTSARSPRISARARRRSSPRSSPRPSGASSSSARTSCIRGRWPRSAASSS